MLKLKRLIVKDILGLLTVEEQQELVKLKNQYCLSDSDYNEMKRKIIDPDFHQSIVSVRRKDLFDTLSLSCRRMPIVASFILHIFYLEDSDKDSIAIATDQTMQVESSAPRLILSDGTKLDLKEEMKDTTLRICFNPKERLLSYEEKPTPSAQQSSETQYNVLVIPKGGEFNLTLSDGTQVWLNSQTRLRFPQQFSQEIREIFLEEGELYLEVARDTSHPFKVHTSHGVIEVLGTTFNVNSSSSKTTEVTLVSGSVSVSTKNASVILRPNEQAIMAHSISVREVDVEEIISWKDDMFYFPNATLETILGRLALWYDFKVFYVNESVKQKKFFIRIDKYASVDKILETLEEVGNVHFQKENNLVRVSKNKRICVPPHIRY